MDSNNHKFVLYKGYQFRINSKYKGKIYYVCKESRSKSCKTKLTRIKNEIITNGIAHTCNEKKIESSSIISMDKKIKEKVHELSRNIKLNPIDIYSNIISYINSNPNLCINIPTKSNIKNMVHNIREQTAGLNINKIWSEEYSKVDGMTFFRSEWNGIINKKKHQQLVWMTDEAIALLRANNPVLIDGTFKVAPKPFYQLVILMTYDVSTSTFVPCVYSLMTGKCEWSYLRLFHEIITQLDYSWNPKSITCDFEYGLIKAVKHEFPDTNINGCYFHWKQAINRKLSKYGFNKDEVKKVLNEMSFLVSIDPNDIDKGIKYLNDKFLRAEKYAKFWEYFITTWTKKFEPKIWSYFKKNDEIVISTNNALECYNRKIASKFSCAHPSLLNFVEIIKRETQYYSMLLNNIRKGNEPFPIHLIFMLPIIPCSFIKLYKKYEKN